MTLRTARVIGCGFADSDSSCSFHSLVDWRWRTTAERPASLSSKWNSFQGAAPESAASAGMLRASRQVSRTEKNFNRQLLWKTGLPRIAREQEGVHSRRFERPNSPFGGSDDLGVDGVAADRVERGEQP